MSAPVTVTPADREAAAPLLAWWWRNLKGEKTAEFACEGLLDDHELVQAFARHRIATETAATNAALEALRAAESELMMWRHANATGEFIDPALSGAAGTPISALAASTRAQQDFVPPATPEMDALALVRTAIRSLKETEHG